MKAARVPTPDTSTIPVRTIPPAGPKSFSPRIAANAEADAASSKGTTTRNTVEIAIYRSVTSATPAANASGRFREGLRTSPAILEASHQPPKEKNAETKPPASAPRRGSEPGARRDNGKRAWGFPSPAKSPKDASAKRAAILSAVTATSAPAASRVPSAVSPARTRMDATARARAPHGVKGTRDEAD